MANDYSTTDLVNNIVLISHMPISDSTFTAPNIITLANRELQTALVKQLLSVREGYYLTYQDQVNNQNGLYNIPDDSIGAALSNVELIQNTTIIPVNTIVESEQFSTLAPTSTSYGFFIRSNSVQIMPIPNIGIPRFWYLRRPNNLVGTDACGQITQIIGTAITVSSLPSTFQVGTVVQFAQAQPNFDMLGTAVILGINGLEVTIDQTIDRLAVGDWLTLKDQTCIPQIPVELRPLLEQRTVVKMYELQGYLDKMKAAKAQLDELQKSIFDLITPRVQSQTKIIMPINGGFLAGSQRRGNYPAAKNQ